MGQKHRSSSAALRRSTDLVESLESRLLMARAFGIDVSDWQGNINWPQVAASGKSFAFIRATRGGTSGSYNENARTGTLSERYDDTKFLTNINNAQSAGLLVGVYHFARPDIATNTGADEATHFLQVAGNYMSTGYLPPVLDLEAGAAKSKTALTDWALEFCQTIYDAKGVWPIVYANSSYANSEVDSRIASSALWLARPSGDPIAGNPGAASSLPNVYGVWNPFYPAVPTPAPWSFWQYSSTGMVSGISGNVDMDVFNGDLNQLKQQFLQGYTPPDISTVLKVTIAATGGAPVNNGDALSFGTVLQKSVSPTITLQLTNIGNADLTFRGLVAGGLFGISDGLVPTLKPGQSDTFTITLNTTNAASQAGSAQFDIGGATAATFSVNLDATIVAGTSNTTGAIYGFIYDDRNGNGIKDATEFGQPGWDVWADVNGNGVQDPSDPVCTTSPAGEYQFANLAPGLVTIHPVIQPAWYQTTPGQNGLVTINVLPKILTRAKDYAMAKPASISGFVFNDANGNGKRDIGEGPLAGWTVFIDRNLNGVLDAGDLTTTADASGFYLFNNLKPGTYVVRVDTKKGYVNTGANSFYTVSLFSSTPVSDRDFPARALLA